MLDLHLEAIKGRREGSAGILGKSFDLFFICTVLYKSILVEVQVCD